MIIDRSKQQKNLLEMLQEKNEYISAPCNGNGICGKCIVRYKSGATEPTKQDREFLSEKQLEQGYRLACQSYPTEEYKVEIPELEETIEVLSQWENQRTEEILKNTAEGTAEKTENAILWNLHRHRNNDSGGTACESGNRIRLPDCRIR